MSTWRLWTAYITTRKLTDAVSVSLPTVAHLKLSRFQLYKEKQKRF